MRLRLLTCVASGFAASLSLVAADVPVDPAFLQTLHQALVVKTEQRFDPIAARIDWQALEQEAAAAADPAERARRQDYARLWRQLAAFHDYSLMCSMMFAFEHFTGKWLSQAPATAAAAKRRWGGLADKLDPTFDPRPFRRYLLTAEVPAWAASVRYLAAASLTGEGNEAGMAVLMDGIRRPPVADPTGEERDQPATVVLGCSALVCTEAALPLFWQPLADPSEQVRIWAIRSVTFTKSYQAVPLLIVALADASFPARRQAALGLMARDRREAIPVLRQILADKNEEARPSPVDQARICAALERWGEKDVPWAAVEQQITAADRTDDHQYWVAICLAGEAVGAGRDAVALPFLRQALAEPRRTVARHAARTLLTSGRAEGVTALQPLLAAEAVWSDGVKDLGAVATYLQRPGLSPEDRAAALALAQTVWTRSQPQDAYRWRVYEALGKLGALCRVSNEAGLRVTEFIAVPYTDATQPHAAVALFHARLESVQASARQEGLVLGRAWLQVFADSERNALKTLAGQGTAAAAQALEQLAAEEPEP